MGYQKPTVDQILGGGGRLLRTPLNPPLLVEFNIRFVLSIFLQIWFMIIELREENRCFCSHYLHACAFCSSRVFNNTTLFSDY